MLFWIFAALLAALATAVLIFPLMRHRDTAVGAEALHDVEVYKDQLGEVERDLAEGLISASEADVARAEIGRRLIAASKKAEGEAKADENRAESGGSALKAAALAVVIFMPVASLAAYLSLGSPDLPQQPLAARMNKPIEESEIGILITRAEQQLKANPEDGRGWDVLAPIYLRTGRFADSANAFRQSIAINGPSPARQAGLGEALVSAADGIVTEEARLAFQTAREMDPEDPRPRFFLAIALAQEGKTSEAIGAFEALAARAPEGAPWLVAVETQIAALKGQPPALPGTTPGASIAAGPGNPSAEDIAAAASMSPAERMDMIRGMVSGLEERLKDNPGDGDGWLRLVRSLSVLGERERAQAALDRAFAVLPGDSAENRALTEMAAQFGLSANPNLGGVPTSAPQPTAPAVPAQEPLRTGPQASSDGPGGPSQADIEAAAAMSADERLDMIRGMIASLDAKMAADPSNLEGWMRLVQSYVVINDRQSAENALARAADAFPAGSDGAGQLSALADRLGLTRPEDN